MTTSPLGDCPRCLTPLVASPMPGYADCPRCMYTKVLPPPHPRVVSGYTGVTTNAPFQGASAVSATGPMRLVSYCASCGMPSASTPCPHCGHARFLGSTDPADATAAAVAKPLNRRDSAVAAFAPDVRAALDTVLGPERSVGAMTPSAAVALDGMQATFADLFMTLDIAHLEDYPRDAKTLDAGGELVARIAAWGIALMAALYERSGIADDATDGDVAS